MAEQPTYPGIPLWAKASGFIVIVLVVMVIVMFATGAGGDHGPSRHIGGVNTPATSVPAGHTPPSGGR